MATMGLKVLAWAEMETEPSNAVPTFSTGIIIGKAVSTGLTITNAEGELYADDMLAEYVSEFSSGAFTAEADNIELEYQARLYGATITDGELQFNAGDNAPYGGIGGYQVLMVKGQRKYRSWVFPKARASIPDWTGTTKGNSITFGTQPVRMRIMSPEFGPWYYLKEFDDESAAYAYVQNKLNISAFFDINVQAQGEGTVTPVGKTMVAQGDDVSISLSGTPTVVYDNGVDVTSSVVDGAYTVSNVTVNHNIAVIF